jgi:hypothetical protein
MWRGGRYLHCDISSGNVFWDGENGQLGDLEYVKCLNDIQTDEVKTVRHVISPHFFLLAIEVYFH